MWAQRNVGAVHADVAYLRLDFPGVGTGLRPRELAGSEQGPPGHRRRRPKDGGLQRPLGQRTASGSTTWASIRLRSMRPTGATRCRSPTVPAISYRPTSSSSSHCSYRTRTSSTAFGPAVARHAGRTWPGGRQGARRHRRGARHRARPRDPAACVDVQSGDVGSHTRGRS